MARHHDNHNRRVIRLQSYDYSSDGAYFITICTYNRQVFFGHIEENKPILNDAGKIARAIWESIPDNQETVKIGKYVIMPNHLHGIVLIGSACEMAETVDPVATQFQSVRAISSTTGLAISSTPVGAIHELPKKNHDETTPVGAIHEPSLRVRRSQLPHSPHNNDIAVQRRKMLLPMIIGRFKMQSAKSINELLNRTGNPLWMKNYYEHVIRNEKEYNAICCYIDNNPVNWDKDEYSPLS